METFRGLLALLCVFLAGAQVPEKRKIWGKFAEKDFSTLIVFYYVVFMALCYMQTS